MATVKLAPGEEYDFNGVHLESYWIGDECHLVTIVDGWKQREVDLDVDCRGGHIDGIDYEPLVPIDEKFIVYGAVAQLARQLHPEIITVEDPDGNLL